MDLLTKLRNNIDEMIEMLTSKTSALEESFSDDTSKDRGMLASDFNAFKSFIWKELLALKTQMMVVEDILDSCEKSCRSKTVILYGIEEDSNEDINDIVQKLLKNKLNLPDFIEDFIVTSLRLGNSVTGEQPCPILIRFVNSDRCKQFRKAAKMHLKGSGLKISAFYHHVMHTEVRKALGMTVCFTYDLSSSFFLELRKHMHKMADMFTSKMCGIKECHRKGSSSQGVTVQVDEIKSFKAIVLEMTSVLKIQMDMAIAIRGRFEKRSNAKTLLLLGVSENHNKDIADIVLKIFKDRLCLPHITKQNVSLCLRLGSEQMNQYKDTPRPIIVCFNANKTRYQVWQAKSCLKGSGLTLVEYLPASVNAVFVEARKTFTNCWRSNGKIVVSLPSGERRKITTMGELQEIMATCTLDTNTPTPSSKKLIESDSGSSEVSDVD